MVTVCILKSGHLDRNTGAWLIDLPLAVGFGVKSYDDIVFLRGKADIAVVGSETIRVLDNEGLHGIDFYRNR